MNKRLLCVSLALFSTSAASAAVFNVAPDGNDANPGTSRKPFATIAKARDAARAVPGPHTILLAKGRYFVTDAILFDDRDSGLTIRGRDKGAAAEVYGGVPVTGWEKWKGDIWRAPVPKGKRFFNLIVDGKPATMAQTPDAGSGFGGGAGLQGNTGIVVPADWRGYDYSDAQVFAFIGANWFSEMREVLQPSPDSNGVVQVDGGSGGFGGMNDRFFLRGVLEFLDEPGEWCLKHKEGFVYYWSPDGAPAKHLVIQPTCQRLFDVHGRTPQTTANNIVVENLSLVGSDFCARWFLFGPGEDGSTPESLQQGLVFGENVDGLKVRNCRVLAAGHSGVWLNYRAQNCVVENCLISGAGFAGIYANGFMPGKGEFKSGAESYVNKGHRVENNFIHDCGKYVGGGCGIQFYQSGDSVIARNEIGEMPRYGISFKGQRWGTIPKVLYGQPLTFDSHFNCIHTRNLKVVGNEIYSVCRNSFDFGAIECWSPGRDNLWAGNDLHDIDQTLDWDGWAHVLFADDASHWLTISGNIIHHCSGGQATGAFMLKNIEENIENNLVVDCDIGRLVTFEPFVEPAWNMSIRHNIFAVDGVNTRYGNINEFSLKGKPFDGVEVPKDASGFREVNNNWIAARDTNNPNPLAQFKMDLDSTFGPAPVKRTKPDCDATAADYRIEPPKWFKPIDASKMGLKNEFPFDKSAFTRRPATGKIQAESYQRTHVLRTSGGVGIYNLAAGSWAKYANIDFGKGVSKVVFKLDAQTGGAADEALIELRLDSPEGKVIGRLLSGRSECGVDNAGGIHNLYLVFPGGKVGTVDWFRFEP